MTQIPPIELRHLRAFVAVAEELHFGRAAERLGMAQPPLSQQIRRLEANVGHDLFVRDTRNVTLTDAGKTLLTVARKLLEDARLGLERVRRVGRGETNTLTVGFTASLALEVLPAVVQPFKSQYPGISLRFLEFMPNPLYDALHEERIDLALTREPAPALTLQAVPLASEPFVAVLPARHPLAKGKGRLAMESLAEEDFILFPRDDALRHTDKVIDLCLEAGFAPRMTQEALGWQPAVSLVSAGLGVTILPRCVSSLRAPGVAYREIQSSYRSTIMVVYRADDTRPMLENFITTARQALADWH
jgi:DNA-binding transcriptional LysR family regulator